MKFEREFLGLAKWWLVCRLQVMGGKVEGSDIPDGGLGFSLLGMLDQEIAMEMLCSEARGEAESARRANFGEARFSTMPIDREITASDYVMGRRPHRLRIIRIGLLECECGQYEFHYDPPFCSEAARLVVERHHEHRWESQKRLFLFRIKTIPPESSLYEKLRDANHGEEWIATLQRDGIRCS